MNLDIATNGVREKTGEKCLDGVGCKLVWQNFTIENCGKIFTHRKAILLRGDLHLPRIAPFNFHADFARARKNLDAQQNEVEDKFDRQA